MTIDTPENKTATQKFNEFFKEIAEKYWIKNFEELKNKELTKKIWKILSVNIISHEKINTI